MTLPKLLFTALVFTSLPLLASTSIDWNGGSVAGVRDENSTLTPVAIDSIWVLYFAGADNLIDPIDPLGSLDTASGDDEVLIVANNASQAGRLNNSDLPGGNSVQNFGSSTGEYVGFFYTRVFNFQDGSIDSSNNATWDLIIPDGTFYYESPTFGPSPETNGIVPSPTPLDVYWDGSDAGISTQMVDQFFAIPEPSTFMSVLLAGGTVLFAMRRRYRN